jgi:hypothetical protein
MFVVTTLSVEDGQVFGREIKWDTKKDYDEGKPSVESSAGFPLEKLGPAIYRGSAPDQSVGSGKDGWLYTSWSKIDGVQFGIKKFLHREPEIMWGTDKRCPQKD